MTSLGMFALVGQIFHQIEIVVICLQFRPDVAGAGLVQV